MNPNFTCSRSASFGQKGGKLDYEGIKLAIDDLMISRPTWADVAKPMKKIAACAGKAEAEPECAEGQDWWPEEEEEDEDP